MNCLPTGLMASYIPNTQSTSKVGVQNPHTFMPKVPVKIHYNDVIWIMHWFFYISIIIIPCEMFETGSHCGTNDWLEHLWQYYSTKVIEASKMTTVYLKSAQVYISFSFHSVIITKSGLQSALKTFNFISNQSKMNCHPISTLISCRQGVE